MTVIWISDKKNENHIKRGIISNLNKLSNGRVRYNDDIIIELMGNVLQYFMDGKDYDPERGASFSTYIYDGIENCVKRYYTDLSNEYARMGQYDLEDSLSGKYSLDEYEDSAEEIEMICKALEYKRYKYGIDLFFMAYVGLRLRSGKARDYLLSLGINPKQLKKAKALKKDMQCRYFMMAVARNRIGVEILRKFVYGADLIDRTIGLSYEIIPEF